MVKLDILFCKLLFMFNYIKFWMFFNLGFAWPEMWWNHEETKFQRESQDPQEAVNSLRSKFEAVKAWEGIVWRREEKLRTSLSESGDKRDKEFWQLAIEVEKLRKELKNLWIIRQELWVLLWEIQVEIKKLSPEETDKLKTIDNKEFLSTPFDKRLQYVTTNHVDTSDVSSGQVKELEITFTFDWVYNDVLYSKTTAWQILPKEVWEVKVWWETYSRNGLSWEFFTPSNKRLIIEEWTKIEIWNLRDPEQIEKIQTENLNKTQLFLAENPWVDDKLVSEAIARWIDPKFASSIFKELVNNTPKEDLPQVLEDAFTEFDRIRWYLSSWAEFKDWKYDTEFTMEILLKFNKDKWKEIAKNDFWFSDEEIKHTEDTSLLQSERRKKMEWLSLDDKADFMENAKKIAQRIEEVYWIPWKVTVWQAALESNWWRSWLTRQANNYFWVKSFWSWPSVTMKTDEFENWNRVSIRDGFKMYWSMEESFIWYAEFLTRNRRYKEAFQYWADLNPKPEYYPNSYKWYDPDKFIQEIAKAWYATDPNYARKVAQVWSKFDNV